MRNAAGSTGVIVDVSGYFTAGTTAAGFVPLPQPVRIQDGTIASQGQVDLTVATVAGAPANAVAVVLNLTGSEPSKFDFESVIPSPLTVTPTVSNLSLVPGSTRANLVTAMIGAGGQVTVYNSYGTVRTIVDVVGFYTSDPGGLAYYPLAPARILDTRIGLSTVAGSAAPIGPHGLFDMLTWGTTTSASSIVTVPSTAQAVAFGPANAATARCARAATHAAARSHTSTTYNRSSTLSASRSTPASDSSMVIVAAPGCAAANSRGVMDAGLVGVEHMFEAQHVNHG